MIPLHDANQTRNIPIVTRLLLFVNIALWIYVLYLSRTPGAAEALYERYAFDWTSFTHAFATGHISIDTFMPLFSHQFLHGGWLHVLGNMLYLWIFGDNVEDSMGSLPYLAFYLLCGIVAAVGQGIVAPSPMVGASGAIAGVMGAYLVLWPRARVLTLVPLLLFFVVLQIVEGVAELRLTAHAAAQQVAYFAHVFGFLAGIVLLFVFRQRAAPRRARVGWG